MEGAEKIQSSFRVALANRTEYGVKNLVIARKCTVEIAAREQGKRSRAKGV